MCIPCGPRYNGRRRYYTYDDVREDYSLEMAREKYPDEAVAMAVLFAYTDRNYPETRQWMVDDLYQRDGALIRIAIEPENRRAWNAYIRAIKEARRARKPTK